ncbi:MULTISPECIES: tape measure protein [unclassified Acinetobacter]|uniref:tape measure protein n=1 Tax=unclassified Acinetobacter TaxID=196816 RepID=UPI002934F24E|nr:MULTISPECIES: tape measure protein [unclassified Acinetobacter]WOE32741.1 tape measure protein [Acinetobacter sp. SAAs470]WOE38217.1 tape measure protein [Acinetobacter sp. SAAs474]
MTEQRSRLVIEISTEHARRNAEVINRELKSIEKNGTYATKSMDSMSVAARSLAANMARIVTVGTAINKMDAYTNLQNRLKLVTTSQTELNRAMNDTFLIAQKSYASWDSVVQVYQRFSDNAKRLKIDMTQTAALTETVSKAVAISGASTQAAEAALTQFGQALASGVLRGEELNSVMEQTPGLADAIAEGMGITKGQLRSVAAEGKITGDVLVKALTKAKGSVDELFAKTDITIGQSLTLLNNEVSKFVGGAGQASGASKTLASSIQFLGENLSNIANIAMLGGVAFLTKAIVTQTIAVKTSVATSLAKRAALTAELQSQVTLAAAEVQRTRQVTALAATEVNLARVEYNSAASRTARAAATMRLTQAEIAYNLASKQSTIATTAQTAAQNALNASQLAGSRMLALVGGPVGALTWSVTALAAGYIYMQGKASEANKKLEEQASVAKKAKNELLALKGLEKDDAINDMAEAFERQNKALAESSSQVNIQLTAIKRLYSGNKDIVKVVDDAQNGTISMTTALKKFNELRISKDIYTALKENIFQFVKHTEESKNSKEKLHLFGREVVLAGRDAQTSAVGVDENTKSLSANEIAAQKAAKAQKDYKSSLYNKEFEAVFTQQLLAKGLSEDQIKAILEASQWARKNNVKFTTELAQEALRVNAIEQANKKIIDDRNNAEREATKEKEKHLKLSEKQAALLAGNDEKVRNMLRVYQAFRNAGLGDKQARVMTAQVGRENDYRADAMFGSHKDSNNGYTNTGFLSWQKVRSTQLMQSLQGQGLLDSKGKIQQTQDSLDAMAKFFVQEVMSGKSYASSRKALTNDNLDYRTIEKIVGKNGIGWDYDGKGKLGKTKAASHLSKQDSYYNKISEILGKDPENIMSAIKDLSKFQDEAYKARAKTEEEVKQLQIQYDTDAVKRSKLRDEEINRATILGQQALIPQINARYDAQDQIAKLQLDAELNAYKWTEEQKLQNTRDINIQRLTAEGQYSEAEIALRKKALDTQTRYEIDQFKRTQALKLREFDLTNASEMNQAKQKAMLYSLDSSQRQGYSLSIDERSAYDANTQNLLNKNRAYEDELRQRLITQQQYNLLLENAVRAHEENKAAIQAEYSEKYQELQRNQYQGQLQIWGNLLSQGQTTWSQLTQSIKDASGEQSSAYKVALAAQQAFSIASTLVSTHLAAAQVMADPSALTLAQKTMYSQMILGMGYANAGLIAAQTIAGFSEGGYTGHGGKYDPAGIVHKGEVVFSQADIARLGGVGVVESMRKGQKGYSDGGVVGLPKVASFTSKTTSNTEDKISIQVTVTDSGVSTQSSNGDKKVLGDMIGNAVRAVIRQEQRQGGLLAK